MPKTIRVVSPKNIKPKFPVAWTISIFLLLDHFNAAQWVWGAVGVFIGIIWLAIMYVLVMWKYEEVDLFAGDDRELGEIKQEEVRKAKAWAERLEEMEKKYKA